MVGKFKNIFLAFLVLNIGLIYAGSVSSEEKKEEPVATSTPDPELERLNALPKKGMVAGFGPGNDGLGDVWLDPVEGQAGLSKKGAAPILAGLKQRNDGKLLATFTNTTAYQVSFSGRVIQTDINNRQLRSDSISGTIPANGKVEKMVSAGPLMANASIVLDNFKAK